MTETLCPCGRPVNDATLCIPCAHKLDDAIAEICGYQGLGHDLDIALSKQAAIVRPGGRPDEEEAAERRQAREERLAATLAPQPLPYDQRAGDAARALRRVLASWAARIATETGISTWKPAPGGPFPICRRCQHPSCLRNRPPIPPPTGIAPLASWLRPRVGWLRHHHDAARAYTEIMDAVGDARAAVDRPAERLYAGPCDVCGEDLYARHGARIVECPACDPPVVYTVEDRRAWLLRAAEDVLATSTELSRAISTYGQPITPEAIRGYVHRGQLVAHGQKTVGKRVLPLYRLGDVLDILARQAEREGRMAG